MSRPQDAPAPIDRLARPVGDFGRRRITGAVLMLTGTLVAFVVANSPWREAYEAWRHEPLRLALGELVLEKPLVEWVNEGLMGIFFLVVGLEIKREVLVGELSSWRSAALPALAAAGGMLVPAALYLAVTWDGAGRGAWGVPVATDIAFALGVVSLFERRVPRGLVVLLTAFAIVDDIGAILVIALVYTQELNVPALGLGGAFLGVSVLANALGVRTALPYAVLGLGTWLCFLLSGVHATLAAVLLAFTVPARIHVEGEALVRRGRSLLDHIEGAEPTRGSLPGGGTHEVLEELSDLAARGVAPLRRFEHALMPVVTFLVLPVFAAANAGVPLPGTANPLEEPVYLGIVTGLLVGKPVGILLFSAVSVWLGVAELPEGCGWTHIAAVSVLGGLGFTMSLFIASLALQDAALHELARLAVLTASAVAALGGALLLGVTLRRSAD